MELFNVKNEIWSNKTYLKWGIHLEYVTFYF